MPALIFSAGNTQKASTRPLVALSVKKAEEAVITYFDQLLAGEDFTYVYKGRPTDNTQQIEQLQRELSRLSTREARIREAYESGIDSLDEYKANKERLVSARLELNASLQNLLQDGAS